MKALFARLRSGPLLPLRPVLFLLVLPLLASLILGYQFSGNVVQHVPTLVVDHDNSALSRSLVRAVQTNQAFDVIGYSDLDHDIEDRLLRGEATAGLLIPKGFEKDLLSGRSPRVLAFYDGSQMSMTGAAKSRLAEVLASIRAGFLIQLSEGKLGLQPQQSAATVMPMTYTIRILGNPTKNTPEFLLGGVLYCVVLVAMAMLGIELVAGVTRYRQLWWRGLLAAVPGTLALVLVPAVQGGVFGVPFEGTLTAALVLMVLFALVSTALGTSLVLVLKTKQSAIGIAGFLSAMMLFAGYTFPLFAMPEVFQGVAWFLPFTHFGLPLRDIELVGRSLNQVMPDVLWLAGCTLVLWGLNLVLFRRRGRVV